MWKEEDLKNAIEAVHQKGVSQKKAATEFGIPRTTLRDRLKANDVTEPRLGRKCVFSAEQEQQLAEHVVLLSKLFYGITTIELRRLAFDLAEKHEIKHNFSKETKLAGIDWLNGFLSRHKISLRKPEATSLNRVRAFNKDEVDLFYKNLDTVMTKYNFPPNRIHNMDETGISTVQKPGKILAPRGQKQVGGVTSWERGKNITVVCAMSASGIYTPPMFIYPRKRMSPLLQRGGPPGAIYRCSHNGWSNEELFLDWLKHFQRTTKSSEEDPVLLLMDNHGSHISLQCYDFCRTHHIHVVSLPPHSSHRLQPLDVSFYGPLKNAFNKECDNFMKTNFHQNITPYDIAPIFSKAYLRIATLEKAVAGFKACGIFPFQPDKFSEDDFAPAHSIVEQIIVEDKEENSEKLNDTATNEAPNDENPADSPASATAVEIINRSQPRTSSGKVDFSKSILEISPMPANRTDSKQKVQDRKQHSIILTSTPMKDVLEDAKEKKELKQKAKAVKRNFTDCEKNKNIGKKSKTLKQNKRTVISEDEFSKNKRTKRIKKTIRPKFDFDETSSEDFDDDKLCDDDSNDDISLSTVFADEEKCLICGEFGGTELWYRCTLCSKWAHSQCSGKDSAKNYVCDFCE